MTTCPTCAEHGRWPQGHIGTHCRECHDSWAGNGAHTMCCHRTFSSNNAADAHLRRGICTDPATLPGFELITRAHGYKYWTPMSGVETHEMSDETGLEVPA